MPANIVIDGSGWRHLIVDGIDWMQDPPDEISTQKELASHAYGNVLVAGLGLCIYHRFVLDNPDIVSLTTVEISQDVIDLIKTLEPTVMDDPRHKVVCADIFTWEYPQDQSYDVIYGDVWLSRDDKEIKDRFDKTVTPLLKSDGLLQHWMG